MKQHKRSNVYQTIMGASLIAMLIAVWFSMVMMLITVVAQEECWGSLCLSGLAVSCISFIVFTITLFFDRRQKKKLNTRRSV
jgi:uncharacterized membrane protein